MLSLKDLFFSKILLVKQYVTNMQIIEGVSIKERLLEEGIPKSLGEIMLEHHLITSRQFEKVKNIQDHTLITCKSCGLKYQLSELEVEDIFHCEVCGSKVLELSELASLSLEPLFAQANMETAILESQSFFLESLTSLGNLDGSQSFEKTEESINNRKYEKEGKGKGEEPSSYPSNKISNLEGTTKLRFDTIDDESLELIGKTLAHYQILEKLGEGGSCVVFKAMDLHSHTIVALKVLKRSEIKDRKVVDRLIREAKVAGKLSHSNIVKVLDSGHTEGYYYYIVLEYVDGETLREKILQHQALPIPVAIQIFRQVLQGLAAAHGEGYIHRDIKPDNIMIDFHGKAKITDFGLAKGRTIDAHITQTGQILGTPYYMSPEQAQTSKLDLRSDIYSLGVTMYYALAGRVPFEGATPIEIILKHISTSPMPLSAINPMVPEKLEAIIHKMLAKKVEDRYQSAMEILEDLQEFSSIQAICSYGHRSQYSMEKGGSIQICKKCQRLMVVPLYTGQKKCKCFGYPDWKDFLICKIGIEQGYFTLDQGVEALQILIDALRYGLYFSMKDIYPFFTLSEKDWENLLEALYLDIDLQNYPFLLGQIAIREGLISEQQLLTAILIQKERKRKERLGDLFTQKNMLSSKEKRKLLRLQKDFIRTYFDQKFGEFLVSKNQLASQDLSSILETLKEENRNGKDQCLLGWFLEKNDMNESILENLLSRFLYQQLPYLFVK